jgi:hypothetical protein
MNKTIEKICEFCEHPISIHKYNGINQCALCECSLSQAPGDNSPGNNWWTKVISWLT